MRRHARAGRVLPRPCVQWRPLRRPLRRRPDRSANESSYAASVGGSDQKPNRGILCATCNSVHVLLSHINLIHSRCISTEPRRPGIDSLADAVAVAAAHTLSHAESSRSVRLLARAPLRMRRLARGELRDGRRVRASAERAEVQQGSARRPGNVCQGDADCSGKGNKCRSYTVVVPGTCLAVGSRPPSASPTKVSRKYCSLVFVPLGLISDASPVLRCCSCSLPRTIRPNHRRITRRR